MTANLVLSPQQRLTRVSQDRSAKGHVYVVRSRDSGSDGSLILGQSLPALSRYINTHLSHEQADSVSVTSLYDNLNCTGGRNGGYVSGRWKVRTVPLEQASLEFERERSHEPWLNAVVVAADAQMYGVDNP